MPVGFPRASLAALFVLGLTSAVLAQSAGSATSGAAASAAPGGGTPTPSTPPPSGGSATGKPVIGAETPVEQQEDAKEKKETTICKGC